MREHILIARWLRSNGLQNADIAEFLGIKGHQNVSYHFRKLRKAFLDKVELAQSNGAEVVSPLVGLASDLPPPSHEIFHPDHNCIHFVKMAAYAQMEDLPKEKKLWVILELLKEVEAE